MQDRLRRLNERRKQDEGFTLIELLVVIVILGILAAVVVFAVGGITDRGEESACEATSKAIEVASEAYNAQEDGYAASLAALETADFINIDDDLVSTATAVTTEGGVITYVPATGKVTDTCA